MPIFDFVCTRCQKQFEMLVLGSTQPLCPACKSSDLQKLISMPAPPNKSKRILEGARRQAAREGHFSNYAKSELPRRK